MVKTLFIAFLTLLFAVSGFGVTYNSVWERSIEGAEGFIKIKPLMDIDLNPDRLLMLDNTDNRLLLLPMDGGAISELDLPARPVDFVHFYSGSNSNLFIIVAMVDPQEQAMLSLISFSDEFSIRETIELNTFAGIGSVEVVEFSPGLRFNSVGQPTAITASVISRFSEISIGQGMVSEDVSTYLEYSIDLVSELSRKKLSRLDFADLTGDEQPEVIRSVNYSYRYQYPGTDDDYSQGETGFRSLIIRNEFGNELFTSNSYRGRTRHLFTGDFDLSIGNDELIVAGEADDLISNHPGNYPHIASYGFVGNEMIELWYTELPEMDILYASTGLNIIAGLSGGDNSVFLNSVTGVLFDSVLFSEPVDAAEFFVSGSTTKDLNLVGRHGDRLVLYRLEWRAESNDELSAGEPVPSTFELHQNHPNPFNGETVLSFENEVTQQLQLLVFNILGQKIATLYNGISTSGTFFFTWNGFDDFGRAQASGMYFAQLKSADDAQMIKLIYLK